MKTAPRLPDGTPFPTLYYLTHPALTAAASRLESAGVMREMTERLQRRSGAGRGVPPRARVLPRRARRDRVAGNRFHRRRHAGPGQVPARADGAFAGEGPGVNPFGDEALAVLAVEPAMAGILDRGTRGTLTQGRRDRLRHQLDPPADRRRRRRRPARRAPRDAHRATRPGRRRHGQIRARGDGAHPGGARRLRRPDARARRLERCGWSPRRRPGTPPTATSSSR